MTCYNIYIKPCSKCQQNKNFDQFYKNSASKSGYSAYCKECDNEYQRRRRGSKREYGKSGFISETHKECTKCREIKNIDGFTKNSGNKSGIHSWCKQCMSEKVLEYRGGRVLKVLEKTDTHKQCRLCEKIKPYSEYAGIEKKSKRRETYCKECKKFMGTESVLRRYHLNVEEYMKIFNSQKGVCKICKQQELDGKRLSVDHDHKCCPGVGSCGMCIRGLLCARCNKTLGMVNDNTDYLKSMVSYLQNF